MTTKSIKISEANYELLVQEAARLAGETKRPVSLDAALGTCLRGGSKKSLLDLAELKDEKEFIKALEEAHRTARSDRGRVW